MSLSTARLAVMHVLQVAGSSSLGAEDVYRQMVQRGARASLGTVYRIINELDEKGLLLREWGDHRKALYRLRPAVTHEPVLFLVSRQSGRSVRLCDPVLYERLEAAAQDLELSLEGRHVFIEVDGDASGLGDNKSPHLPVAARAA